MRKLLVITGILLSVQLLAQSYPVTGITITLPMNPDANTATWKSGAGMLTVSATGRMVNGSIEGRVRNSHILVLVKKNGNTACGTFTSNSAPVSNFNSISKIWSGNNAVSLLGQECTLPPGDYELCVQFFGEGPQGMIAYSEEKCKSFTIKANDPGRYQPPQLMLPSNGTVFSEGDLARPVTFRWTPVIPKPQDAVTYRLRVWQLMEGQNATQAMASNQPLLNKDVENLTQHTATSLLSGPCKPPYLCDFVWNVQALNRDGKPIGENNGTGEAFVFRVIAKEKAKPELLLVSPANGAVVKSAPLFTWKSNICCGDVTGDGYFKIKIVEIKGDESPDNAIRTNKPFFEKDSLNYFKGNKPFFEKDSSSSFVFQYPSSAPKLVEGKSFVWQVQALNLEGKPIGGNNGTSGVWKFSVEKQDTSYEETTPSIKLIYPVNGSTLRTIEEMKFVWILNDPGDVNGDGDGTRGYYKIKIVEVKEGQSAPQAFKDNKSFFEKASIPFIRNGKPVEGDDPPLPPEPGKGKTYAWAIQVFNSNGEPIGKNKGMSEVWKFTMGNCDVNLQLKLKEVTCIRQERDKTIYQVCVSAIYSSSLYDLSFLNTGSGLKAYDNTGLVYYPVSGISPALQTQSGGTTVSYCLNVTVPNSSTSIQIGLQGDDKNPGPLVCQAGAELSVTLPTCIISKCSCGTWKPFLVYETSGDKPKARDPKQPLKWACTKEFRFESGFNCNTDNKSCEANISWTVSKDGNPYATGTGASGNFTPTSTGVYTITLNATCNGIKCDPYRYTIKVECNDSKCSCGTWKPFLVYETSGDKPKARDPKQPLKWACTKEFRFESGFICNPDNKSCEAKIGWTVNKDGNPYATGTGASGNFTPTSSGVYTITLNAECNGIKCEPYRYTIKVECGNDSKCSCGTWQQLSVQSAAGTTRYPCGREIQWDCGKRFVFNTGFTCNPDNKDCVANISWKITLNGTVVQTGIGSSGDFIPSANGTYTLTLSSDCNGVKCPACTYKIIVRNCNPSSCNCEIWQPLKVQEGPSVVQYNNNSRITWNCNTLYSFTAAYYCIPKNSCDASIDWVITNTTGDTLAFNNTASGTFTPAQNGTYTLTMHANCNGKKCTPAIYTINVENCPADICTNDVIRNGELVQGNQPGPMPSPGAVQYWSAGYGNPVVRNDLNEGFLQDGYVRLTGNVASGQAVANTLDPNNKIIQGRKYKLSVAVKFNSSGNTLNYAKIRAIAFNGSIFSSSGTHPAPAVDIAIMGRSAKILDCGDWSVIEFPVWVANKDFSNIAINAFTDVSTDATIWIDGITMCETTEDVCSQLTADSTGQPVIPGNDGTSLPGTACVMEAEQDEYYNGSLVDLYPGYDGTTNLYASSWNDCPNIGGEVPDGVDTSMNCDEILQAAGINLTCDEFMDLLNDDFPLIPPGTDTLPLIGDLSNSCDAPKPANMANMPFKGRDIIYIHGLQMSHLVDRATGTTGATGYWPANRNEYYDGGYYKTVAYQNMMPHISHFLTNRGNKNRYLVVTYDCSQSAEVAIHAVLTQIRDAMQNGAGVKYDPSDPRRSTCFGRDFVFISHSTGAVIADVVLSIANKTKVPGFYKNRFGNLGLIADRCKGRVNIQGAYSGSNLAKIACLGEAVPPTLLSLALHAFTLTPINVQNLIANPALISNSILVDLVPNVTRARWGSLINDVPVPVFNIVGAHPSAILGPLKKIIHPGFDDGVLTMDCANANDNSFLLGPSRFAAPAHLVFDMGIPLLRAIEFFTDRKLAPGQYASACTPYLSPTGMVEPVLPGSVIVPSNNHFNNHYSFVQSTKEHWFNATEPGSGNVSCDYSKTVPGAAVNNEEVLVVEDPVLLTPGLIDPAIIPQVGETQKDLHISYPVIRIIYRRGIPRPTIYWKKFYIWKRLYHKLNDNCMYDVDYGYKYLFTQ